MRGISDESTGIDIDDYACHFYQKHETNQFITHN